MKSVQYWIMVVLVVVTSPVYLIGYLGNYLLAPVAMWFIQGWRKSDSTEL